MDESVDSEKDYLFAKRRVVYHDNKDIEHDFSIVQYNVLHDIDKSEEGYTYCPDQFKYRFNRKDSYRHKLLLRELRWLNPDIMCLQEVNLWHFEILQQELGDWGYSGELAKFGKNDIWGHGVALFYRNSKFKLVRANRFELGSFIEKEYCKNENHVLSKLVSNPEVLQAVALQFRDDDSYLVIGNIHVLWGNLVQPVTSTTQVAVATQVLNHFLISLKNDIKEGSFRHIFCGDFNSEPSFPAYHLLSEGKLTESHMCRLKSGGRDYIKWPALITVPPLELHPEEMKIYDVVEHNLTNPLKTLKSAYKVVMGKEPEITNHEGNEDFWTLDYIWFSSNSLKPVAVLDLVSKSEVDHFGGLPNCHFPSDHLSLKAYFRRI